MGILFGVFLTKREPELRNKVLTGHFLTFRHFVRVVLCQLSSGNNKYFSHFKILSCVGDSVQSSVLADLAATPQWTSTIFTRMDSSQSSLRDWM